MTSRLTILAAAALSSSALLCAWTPVARAEPRAPPTSEKRALDLFERGAARYREGKFAEAAELFREAYALKPEPVLLRNLARAYEGIEGREAAQSAIDAYQEFLRIDPRSPDRGAIEQRIKALQERIEREVLLERQRDDERSRAERAEQARRAAELEARSRSPERRRNAVPWVIAGVGGATLITGIVFGLLANSRHSAATDSTTDAMTAQRDQSQAKTYAVVANVTLIAGALLTAAGIGWGVVDVSRPLPARSMAALEF